MVRFSSFKFGIFETGGKGSCSFRATGGHEIPQIIQVALAPSKDDDMTL